MLWGLGFIQQEETESLYKKAYATCWRSSPKFAPLVEIYLKTFKVQTIQQTEDQCQLLEQNWCVKALKLPRLLY